MMAEETRAANYRHEHNPASRSQVELTAVWGELTAVWGELTYQGLI